MGNFEGIKNQTVTYLPLSLSNLKGGSNGAAEGGLVGPRVLSDLIDCTAFYRAAFYPEKPKSHADNRSSYECLAGDVCEVAHHKEAIKGLDFFIHVASLPIHYASQEVAPKILAVEMGTLQLAWAVHDENIARQMQGKKPMRIIIYNSTAAILMENQIDWLASQSESKSVAADLRRWLDCAASCFISLTKYHNSGNQTVKLSDLASLCVGSKDSLSSSKVSALSEIFGDKFKALAEIIKELDQLKERFPKFIEFKKFDYYSFFKLLTTCSLRKLASQGIVCNTIVIKPVSILAEGLQLKADPSFTASMINRLLLTDEERKAESQAMKTKDEIWGDRDLDFIPLDELLKIQRILISLPQDRITGNLKEVVLPGAKISQQEAYFRFILPITKKFMVDYLGRDSSEIGKNLSVVNNPNRIEKTTRVVPSYIDPAISEIHNFGIEVLPKVFSSIVFNIVNGYLTSRDKEALPKSALQAVLDWFTNNMSEIESARLPQVNFDS